MSKPIVAIVGRPNVGKSTLFNVLAGETISIVKDTPGVTRDRIYADCNWLNMNFTLVDTGGIEPDSRDIILSQMREQAQIAIDTADVIIFIVDVRQGLQDSDSKVADMLRKSGKPVVLAVNKVDSIQKFGNDVYEFYNLGIGDPIPVSAASRLGIGDLLDEVSRHFTLEQLEEEEDDRPKVAIIGKPNVGKSSIINKLLGENRVIVSNIAGTTRDAVDTEVVYNGTEYIFIDTAGLRRKSKIKEDLERYSIIRTVSAVERADVVILVIDATEGVTEQEVADQMLGIYLSLGADGYSFPPLVAFGANAADPHHAPDDTAVKPGDCVLFDVGCIKDGYCSDMTRTFYFKTVSEEHRKVYETTRAANEAAISKIRPGVPLRNLDAAARNLITEAGWGPNFNHRLGHFIGLSEHEFGDVSSANNWEAKPGMIFSIEPGIYLTGDTGVRVEDLVLVTEDGVEVLNHYPKNLQIIE